MASKKKVTSNSATQQLIAAMNEHGIAGGEDIAKRLERNEKLTRKQIKAIQELRKQENISYQERLKQIQRLEKMAKPEDHHKARLATLREQNKQYREVSNSIDVLIVRNDSLNESIKETDSSARSSSASLLSLGSVMDGLGSVVRVVTGLYDRWFNIQSLLNQSIGTMARNLGSSASQIANQQELLSGLRDTFAELDGSVNGIASSAEFLQSTLAALRVDTMSQDMAQQMIAIQRGLGMSVEQSANLSRLVSAGMIEGTESVGEFALQMQEFAEGIGANAATLSSDFMGSSDALAAFGANANNIFREAATYANHFGFEAGRILQSMRRFETFSEGAEQVNQLNQMFGTTISSIEMLEMSMEDPMAAFEHILGSVRATGISWDQMTNAQRRQLATSLQLSETETQRVLQGESLSQIQEEQARAQAEREEREQRGIRAQETLNDIIMRTSTAFYSFSERIDQVVLVLTEILSPIFKAVYDSTQGIAVSLREWVRRIADNPRFQEVIRNVANWIRELPQTIERMLPSWEEIEATGVRIWEFARNVYNTFMNDWLPVIRDEILPALNRIWNDILRPMINFVSEHPIGAAIAGGLALALPSIIGSVGSVGTAIAGLAGSVSVGLLVPLGIAAAAIAALGASYHRAISAEEERISEGQLVSSRDPGTLARLQNTGLEELARRNAAGSLEATNTWGLTTFQEGVGMLSGQEADQRRNNIESVIDDIVRPGNMNPLLLAQRARESLGANLADSLAHERGFSDFNQYIVSRYAANRDVAPHFASTINAYAGSHPSIQRVEPVLAESITPAPTPEPPASATTSAPVTAATVAAAPTVAAATTSPGEVRIVAANVELDGRNIGRAFFEISRGA